MRVNNGLIFDGYVNGTDGYNSDPYRIQHFTGFSATVTVANQASFGATAKLQASNDEGPDQFGAGAAVANWVDLPNSGSTANLSLSTDGSKLWNVSDTYYKWIRVVVTPSAGDADVSIRVNGKGPDAQ